MMGIDLGSSTMHNSFYFKKFDNKIVDIEITAKKMQEYIEALLTSKRRELRLRVKDWGRAFINFGIMRHIQGERRPIPCGAGADIFFLDPYGSVLACNGSDEPWVMGNLNNNTFDEIWNSKEAKEARNKVATCQKNCWMVGSARPAMRAHPWVPISWIIRSKIGLMRKRDIWHELDHKT
jgi:MoaA/NifB/PqqE/SkfB family radical SAM enzyme